ncbi:MAG: N-acyl-D-amino-acid deacylase family protein [Streptosporangiales bacterium]
MPATLVLRGGTVHDGSGDPGRLADVVIDGDRIGSVTPTADVDGVEVLDVSGMVVAPGFINVLSHAYFSLQRDPRGLSDLYQGVTTETFGEGVSIGPLPPAAQALLEPGLEADHPSIDWPRLSLFLAHLESRGVAQNVASFVGAENLRMLGAGADDRALTAQELSHVRGVLDEEMSDGALGLGSALIYPPGCFASTDELVALSEVVARYDGLYISHMRSEGDHMLDAVAELVEIGRRADVRAEIFHLKTAGPPNWSKMTTAVHMVDAARAAGQQVTADVYPYLAGETALAASIPPAFHEGGTAQLIARLRDPSERERMRKAVLSSSDGWENLYQASGGAGGVLLLPDASSPAAPYRGLTVEQAAERDGKNEPVDALLDLVALDPSLAAMYFMMDEDCLRTALHQPWVSVGSDAATFAAEPPCTDVLTHPRAYGTFARILGHYARDEGLLTLEEAIRRLTSLPAANLRLRGRGMLAPGNYADVVVFDPSSVADVATYDDPHRYATGVRHVMVNGELALRDGVPTGRLTGRALKRGA